MFQPKKHNCLKCDRPIHQRGNCLPCNIKAKKVREGKDSDEKVYQEGTFKIIYNYASSKEPFKCETAGCGNEIIIDVDKPNQRYCTECGIIRRREYYKKYCDKRRKK